MLAYRNRSPQTKGSLLSQQILQEIDVHFSTVAVPGTRSPCLRDDINVPVCIDVADLEFVSAELRVEDDVFAEFQFAKIFVNDPRRVFTAGRKQFVLLI